MSVLPEEKEMVSILHPCMAQQRIYLTLKFSLVGMKDRFNWEGCSGQETTVAGTCPSTHALIPRGRTSG